MSPANMWQGLWPTPVKNLGGKGRYWALPWAPRLFPKQNDVDAQFWSKTTPAECRQKGTASFLHTHNEYII